MRLKRYDVQIFRVNIVNDFRVLDLNQTKADTFVGTPSYMSPELFLGKSYNHKVGELFTVKII